MDSVGVRQGFENQFLQKIFILKNKQLFVVIVIVNPCNKETDFTFTSGTEVYHSCSIVWRDEMFVFGGDKKKHQISKVENCQLKLVGQLSMVMDLGACTNVGNELVFICFHDTNDSSTRKK